MLGCIKKELESQARVETYESRAVYLVIDQH